MLVGWCIDEEGGGGEECGFQGRRNGKEKEYGDVGGDGKSSDEAGGCRVGEIEGVGELGELDVVSDVFGDARVVAACVLVSKDVF